MASNCDENLAILRSGISCETCCGSKLISHIAQLVREDDGKWISTFVLTFERTVSGKSCVYKKEIALRL
jgi:hypothetical protein